MPESSRESHLFSGASVQKTGSRFFRKIRVRHSNRSRFWRRTNQKLAKLNVIAAKIDRYTMVGMFPSCFWLTLNRCHLTKGKGRTTN